MSSTTLYRLSGISLLIGSLLSLLSTILSAVLYPGHNTTSQQILSASWLIVASLFFAGALLFVMGLPGLYPRQAARTGMLGFVGFMLIWLGELLGGVGFASVQSTIWPYLAQSAPKLLPSGGTGPDAAGLLLIFGPVLLLAVGAILLGIATIRARVFPQGAGVLLLVAGIVSLISIPIPVPSAIGNILEPLWNVLFFLAFGWFGYLLMTQKQETAEVVTRPTAQVGASQ